MSVGKKYIDYCTENNIPLQDIMSSLKYCDENNIDPILLMKSIMEITMGKEAVRERERELYELTKNDIDVKL